MSDNDKRVRVVLYIIAVVSILYGVKMAVVSSTGGGKFSFSRVLKTADINQTAQEKVKGIKEISIDVSSAKINIIPEKRDDVRAHLTGRISTSAELTEPKLETSIEGGRLDIKVKVKPQTFFIGVSSIEQRLNVYIPESYSESLIVSSSSGGLNISNLKLNKLSCKLSSGRVELSNITVEDLNYNVSSGSIKASAITTKRSEFISSSGKIEIEDFSGDLRIKSSSGSIKVSYSNFNNSVDMSSSSGSIDLYLPKNAEFDLSARTSSGRITCKLPISINNEKEGKVLEGTVGSGKNKVTINASSGNININ
jgi:lia operon protein LiaG